MRRGDAADAHANVRAALALMHNTMTGLALKYETSPTSACDAMRIAVVGGGPGGLYSSILIRKVRPDSEVTVFERNAPRERSASASCSPSRR